MSADGRGGGSRPLWRSLEERESGPAPAWAGEFPPGAEPPQGFAAGGGVSRRELLKLSGAIAALGLLGCTNQIAQHIVPYANQPPEVTPGVARFYATAMTLDGFATGLLAESHEGHPTKVEGNPEHPASLGAAGVFEQASIYQLYDPDRARTVTEEGAPSSFDAFARGLRAALGRMDPGRSGERLRFLLEPQTSPTVARVIERIREARPGARFHYYAPLVAEAPLRAARALLGKPLAPRLRLEKAKRILALDADFLASGPAALRDARHFARRRDPEKEEMSRLYAIEPGFTPTGAAADHRLPRRGGEVPALALALLAEVALVHHRGPEEPPGEVRALLERARAALAERDRMFVKAAARDLAEHAGACVVVAGERQPEAVHAAAILINWLLGAAGNTVEYAPSPLLGAGDEEQGLDALLDALERGEVDRLVIVGGDPARTVPRGRGFAEKLARVKESAYVGLHRNATALACRWFIPAAHYLESWGDARAFDGTASIVQPLVEPLFGGRTAAEVLSAFLAEGPVAPRELVRETWRERSGKRGDAFEAFFTEALVRGVIRDTRIEAEAGARARWDGAATLLAPALERPPAGTIEAAFARSPGLHDGTLGALPHLFELPEPLTKLTWENAALLSPALAARLGIVAGQVVELALGPVRARVPVDVLPGHADESVTLPLGWGARDEVALEPIEERAPEMNEVPRRDLEPGAARGPGFDAFALRPAASPWFAPGLSLKPAVDERQAPLAPAPVFRSLATTQRHFTLEGRDLARSGTLEELRADPRFAAPKDRRELPLYEPWNGAGRQWAMAIDLSRCTGCNACVMACMVENNVPTVGRDDVLAAREMHWLRIDRYFDGPPEDPRVVFEPMLCQHCEAAPCEYVCPVFATTHSQDGLNEQVYNRCVGTRFCSNNCPYKVRRFNWLAYNQAKSELQQLAMNPDVTVRGRGVMEKCTFCVQRIRRADIDAAVEGRPERALEVATACQQACPSEAIVFGAVSEPRSEVSERWRSTRAFAVLDELHTRPRIRYLARIRNPNPELEGRPS
ncbi:MAG TPA: TAT-variant-translocated molybdopterin oxidoreductase [Planctomycetota bacterium]|nr:TAT-variant-translocated molybdopterin oxidoreductase [Planctomycetota bacterium]